MPHPSLDDLVKARQQRAVRWNTFASPRSAADEIDHRRYVLDREIEQAQYDLRQAQRAMIDADQHLANLLARRDEYDTLEAEVAEIRRGRLHAEYVEREPAVLVPSVYSDALRAGPRAVEA